jgi:hypothetical protein
MVAQTVPWKVAVLNATVLDMFFVTMQAVLIPLKARSAVKVEVCTMYIYIYTYVICMLTSEITCRNKTTVSVPIVVDLP